MHGLPSDKDFFIAFSDNGLLRFLTTVSSSWQSLSSLAPQARSRLLLLNVVSPVPQDGKRGLKYVIRRCELPQSLMST